MSIPGFRGGLEFLHAAARDAQLAANLARAQQLAEEARQLIVGDYARAASAIVETLARLAAIESEVRCSTRASARHCRYANRGVPRLSRDARRNGGAARHHFGRRGLLGHATATPDDR
jgi:hypothetical protein